MFSVNAVRRPVLLGLVVALALVAVAACGPGAQPEANANTGGGGDAAPVATSAGSGDASPENTGDVSNANTSGGGETGGEAATQAPGLPEDVPLLPNAEKLVVTADGTYISYEADTSMTDATTFYQEQLTSLGWEKKSKKDTGFGDSITLLRSKPDYNISITIQTVAGQDNRVRVLMTLIKN